MHGNTDKTDECLLLYTLDDSGQNFDRAFIKTVDIDIGDGHECSFSKKFLQFKESWIQFDKRNPLTLF